MDRFIEFTSGDRKLFHTGLKSNMDRFIEMAELKIKSCPFWFKIQYG